MVELLLPTHARQGTGARPLFDQMIPTEINLWHVLCLIPLMCTVLPARLSPQHTRLATQLVEFEICEHEFGRRYLHAAP